MESLIDSTIDQILSDSPSSFSVHRNILAARIVTALESDPEWVQPYGVTGELAVPLIEEEGEVGELLARVISVGFSNSPDPPDTNRRCL